MQYCAASGETGNRLTAWAPQNALGRTKSRFVSFVETLDKRRKDLWQTATGFGAGGQRRKWSLEDLCAA